MFYWQLSHPHTVGVKTLYLTIIIMVRQVLLICRNYVLSPSLYNRNKLKCGVCHKISDLTASDHDLFHKIRIPWNSFKCPQFSLSSICSTTEYWYMNSLCCVQSMNHAYVVMRGSFLCTLYTVFGLSWKWVCRTNARVDLSLVIIVVLLWHPLNANKILEVLINLKKSVESPTCKEDRWIWKIQIGDGQFRFTCEFRWQTLLDKYN